jgi:hypothetical membrane protein
MTAADNSRSTQFLTRIGLASAGLMPIIYFATQLIAAPFYSGYSFTHQYASELGTSVCREPWIFNIGIILTGTAAIVAAFGLFQTFRTITNLRVCSLMALAVAYSGFAAIKSGVYPIPDPRHATVQFGLTAPLLMPLLMLIGTWGKDHLQGLRTYLLFSVALLVPVAIFLKGSSTTTWLAKGTLQRLLALGTYVPVGVVGFYFLLNDRKHPE